MHVLSKSRRCMPVVPGDFGTTISFGAHLKTFEVKIGPPVRNAEWESREQG